MKSIDRIAGVKINAEEPLGQLIIELDKAELRSHYVALAEFRDKILPKSGLTWAKDPVKVKSLLKDSVDRGLVLTLRIFNHDDPDHPITAIHLNRSGIRVRPGGNSHRSRPKPIHIPGVSLSDTVIQERREDWR